MHREKIDENHSGGFYTATIYLVAARSHLLTFMFRGYKFMQHEAWLCSYIEPSDIVHILKFKTKVPF